MKPCVILWWGRYVHVRERNAMKIALYHIAIHAFSKMKILISKGAIYIPLV